VRYVRSPTIGATRPSPERADGPSYFRRHDTRKCYAKLLAEGAADKFPGSAVRWGQAEAAKKRKVAPLGNAVCGSRSKSAILAGHLTTPKLEAGCPGDTGPKPGSLPRSVSSHTPDRRCSNGGKTIYLRWQVPLVDWSRDGQQSHMRPIVASTVALHATIKRYNRAASRLGRNDGRDRTDRRVMLVNSTAAIDWLDAPCVGGYPSAADIREAKGRTP
jgi:hypothetical protein